LFFLFYEKKSKKAIAVNGFALLKFAMRFLFAMVGENEYERNLASRKKSYISE